MDWIIIIVCALLIAFDALRSGAARASALSLALPVTVFVFGLISHTYYIGAIFQKFSSAMLQAGVFLAVALVMFFIVYRIISLFVSSAPRLLFSILSAVSATMVMVVVWIQVTPLSSVWQFSPSTIALFGSDFALLWLLCAYLILAFIRS